jgi:RNA-splicing ligase RtcB
MDVNLLSSRSGEMEPEPDVRVFDSARSPADPVALVQLRDHLRDADLVAPPVVLPDFHHKSNMEMPSSVAVATERTIRPTLTSASVNCGMALVAFDMDRPSRTAIERFYGRVRSKYPYPPTYRRDLTPEEVRRAAADGGWFAVDRFGVDPGELDRVEEQGRLDLGPLGGAERVRRELPWSVVQLSRLRFGTIGPGNHFIELQEVEEVLDPAAAERLGIRLGQVTLHYHAGGGSLPGELGVLFGRRKRYPMPVRAQMAVQKPLYHFGRSRSAAELRLRWSLYFRGHCPPVDRTGPEGQRMLLANGMAMNYGFAFRLATYAGLRKIAAETFGPAASRLIVDSPHNSIYEEEVDGRAALVHRHNACRAYPAAKMAGHPVFSETGQPLLLPGTNRTSSFLCVAGDGAHKSLYSACHGAGTMIETFAARGMSGPDARGRSTLRFRYADGEPETVPHLDDLGVGEALSILTRHELVRPVARLRPFAVLT